MTKPHYETIAKLITPSSKVIDIGCGSGTLLEYLKNTKQIDGRGLDVSSEKVGKAVAKGLSVIQGDAGSTLEYYADKGFDYAILSHTLQVMTHPKDVLVELLRIANYVIVSIPNFGYIRNRAYLGFKGRMPMSRTLTYPWYETPNIHFCTIKDFLRLTDDLGCQVKEQYFLSNQGASRPAITANIFAEQAVFLLTSR